jgi:MFS family permease
MVSMRYRWQDNLLLYGDFLTACKVLSAAVSSRSSSRHDSPALLPIERRAAFSLAAIYAMRMLGLFLILPVFALHAEHLQHVTPVLIGVAVGIYGLTQAALQIPFGLLSDRIGRKPVIVGGLLLFALGSIVAAGADTIEGVIAGRALQGSGAVAAAVMALAADLSREEARTRVMATIGISIGAAFILSLVLGPLMAHWIGVPGIFWFTAVMAVGGVLVVLWLVPTPQRSTVHRDAEAVPAQFRAVLRNPELLRLDFGVFTLHMMMTGLFLVAPLILRDLGLPSETHWMVYLPVMLASVLGMAPFIILGEKRRRMKSVLLAAVAALVVAQLGLYAIGDGLLGMVLGLLLFFIAFNLLEASLPSLVAKVSPAVSKGTAMGFFTSSQFLGAFVGGVFGGWAHHLAGAQGVFLFGALAALAWLLVAWGMAAPRYLSSQLLHVGPIDENQAQSLTEQLVAIPGVAEAVVVAEDGVAYLKVDRAVLDPSVLKHFVSNPL